MPTMGAPRSSEICIVCNELPDSTTFEVTYLGKNFWIVIVCNLELKSDSPVHNKTWMLTACTIARARLTGSPDYPRVKQ